MVQNYSSHLNVFEESKNEHRPNLNKTGLSFNDASQLPIITERDLLYKNNTIEDGDNVHISEEMGPPTLN